MLITNFPEQLPNDLPSGVRAFSYLPFSRVLSRCSAVVYPGGIGTVAQTIQAGVPHLVVPHAHDQPDNAARVERLGRRQVCLSGTIPLEESGFSPEGNAL